MTSREQTAAYLVDIRRLKSEHLGAWRRHEHGEHWSAIAEDLSVHRSTLFRWIRRVNDAIDVERRGNPRWGHSVAQGSKVRHVGDPTPTGKLPQSRFPSPERLRETKVRPR